MLRSQRTANFRNEDWGRDVVASEVPKNDLMDKLLKQVDESAFGKLMMKEAKEVAERGGFIRGKLPPSTASSKASSWGGKKTGGVISFAAKDRKDAIEAKIFVMLGETTNPLTSNVLAKEMRITKDAAGRRLRGLFLTGKIKRVNLARGAFGYVRIAE